MSLRLRLLVAVGLIAIVALVVADFATYSALRSSLYNQVDQELAAHAARVAAHRVTQARLAPPRRAGSGESAPAVPPADWHPADRDQRRRERSATGPDGTAASPTSSASPTSAVSTTSGKVVDGLECPAYVGNHAYQPAAPVSDHRLHDAVRRQPGGLLHRRRPRRRRRPAFRVRAPVEGSPTVDGDVLVQAQPLDRSDQHAAHALPDRARRHRGGARARLGRRVVAGPPRSAPARGRRGDGGVDRRGQPRPARARRRPAHRGRPAGPCAQRDARAHPGRVRRPRRVGGNG